MNAEILIEFVRKHELLYNFRMKEHKDSRRRQEAWEKIGMALNTAKSVFTFGVIRFWLVG